jgi:hypothetical protein
MTEAVVADGTQSTGKNMSEVAGCKLNTADGGGFAPVVFGAVFPTEGDGVIGDLDDAGIVDGSACDVSAEIAQSGAAGTGGLDVNAPGFVPDGGIDLPVVFFEQPVKVLAKGSLQMFEENQIMGLFRANEFSPRIESDARHQAMDVWMKTELLVPGVKHGGEAVNGGAQSFVGGKFFRERTRHSGKEKVESFFGVRSKEEAAQF